MKTSRLQQRYKHSRRESPGIRRGKYVEAKEDLPTPVGWWSWGWGLTTAPKRLSSVSVLGRPSSFWRSGATLDSPYTRTLRCATVRDTGIASCVRAARAIVHYGSANVTTGVSAPFLTTVTMRQRTPQQCRGIVCVKCAGKKWGLWVPSTFASSNTEGHDQGAFDYPTPPCQLAPLTSYFSLPNLIANARVSSSLCVVGCGVWGGGSGWGGKRDHKVRNRRC
jgi:hypothetical protein